MYKIAYLLFDQGIPRCLPSYCLDNPFSSRHTSISKHGTKHKAKLINLTPLEWQFNPKETTTIVKEAKKEVNI